MRYIYSFIFCGFVCLVGQLILDNTKLTPGHVTTSFVVLGAALDIFGIYDNIVEIFGSGALVPITSFGHSLIHGAINGYKNSGFIGIFTDMFSLTSAGIISAIVIAFFCSLIFKPKN